MKKNFVAGILAAAMAVTTIGCSGKSNGNTKPTPTPGGASYSVSTARTAYSARISLRLLTTAKSPA